MVKKISKNIELEEFWNKEAPIITREEALKKIEKRFNVTPEFAKLSYRLWRDRYRGSVSCG